MTTYDFDFFCIGAGSGGVRASRIAASLGARRVGVAENSALGGTCVNVGCIPKKLFVYAARHRDDFHHAAGYGWRLGAPDFDWDVLKKNKDREIERLNGVYQGLLEGANVEIFRHKATFVDAHTLQIGDKTVTAENILVASGGVPWVPDMPGHEHVITSNEVFGWDSLPKRVAVLGGGYIAIELAGVFAGLGSQTTLIHRREHVLTGFDGDIREHLTEELKHRMKLAMACHIESVKKTDGGLQVILTTGESFEVDAVLAATGRRPRTDDLDLDKAGVTTTASGAIEVDSDYRTSAPNVFAVGDCIDQINLTPVALAQGMSVAHQLYGNGKRPFRADLVATAVFSTPEAASIGLTEAQAVKEHHNVDVYLSTFRALKLTITDDTTRSMMKLLVAKDSRRVVGMHMVGDSAAEIIQGFAAAMVTGITKEQLDQTVGIHPTSSEEFVTMRNKTRSHG